MTKEELLRWGTFSCDNPEEMEELGKEFGLEFFWSNNEYLGYFTRKAGCCKSCNFELNDRTCDMCGEEN